MHARNRKTLSLALFAFLGSLSVTVASACTREPKQKTPLQRGHWLYSTRCAHCHGAYGKGDGRRMPGPTQPANLANPKLYERLDNAAIKRVVREGKGEMPGFGQWIKDKELDDLIAYLHTLPGKTKQ